VLSSILDGGDSARLARELVRGSRIASSASAGYGLYERQQTLFLLSGVPSDAHTMAELQDALLEQVRHLQESPVSEDELARVKTAVVASEVYQLDSTFYQAIKIGQLEAVDLDWQLLDKYVDRISAVTAEQVQAVARKYLIEDQLTIGVLDPLPIEKGKKQHAAVSGGGHGH
jgi:zinc protease